MNTKAKFLFDTDFDLPPAEEPVHAPAPATFSAEELAAARDEGLQEGLRVGAEQARADVESFLADTLRGIAERIDALESERQGFVAEVRTDAARLAYEIAAKLAPALVRRQPLTEIEAVIRDCLSQMPTEPRVVVRVAEALVEALNQRLDSLAAGSGFAGKLVLIGEPSIAIGDCRVEWADGGAERDSEALTATLKTAIDRFVEAVGADGPSQE